MEAIGAAAALATLCDALGDMDERPLSIHIEHALDTSRYFHRQTWTCTIETEEPNHFDTYTAQATVGTDGIWMWREEDFAIHRPCDLADPALELSVLWLQCKAVNRSHEPAALAALAYLCFRHRRLARRREEPDKHDREPREVLFDDPGSSLHVLERFL